MSNRVDEATGDAWAWVVVSDSSSPGEVYAAQVVSWTATGDPVIAFTAEPSDRDVDGVQLRVVPLSWVRAAFRDQDAALAAAERRNARRHPVVTQ